MALAISWRSTPKSTRVVAAALLWTSLAILLAKINILRDPAEERALHDIVVPYIQLVPRYAVFYPWVFVTAIFAEISVISFLLAFGILYVSTGYVEKFWGYREVLKFILIVGAVTNLSTVIVTIVSNIFRGDVLGMDKPLGGGVSYYFGFLVVFKQLIPEHNVVLFQGLVNFRVKHLPFASLLCVCAWSAFMQTLYPVLPSVMSFFAAYLYLRFHQSFFADPLLPITTASGENSSTYVVSGDASDAFQLVQFFPAISKPYLGPVINSVYEMSVFLGIVTPFNDDAIEQSNMRVQKFSEQVKQANTSIANSVAERRRQVALQVIEERANQA
ncbi:hypothetical protein OXX69_009688 [Metschnikowia pulcherrima]